MRKGNSHCLHVILPGANDSRDPGSRRLVLLQSHVAATYRDVSCRCEQQAPALHCDGAGRDLLTYLSIPETVSPGNEQLALTLSIGRAQGYKIQARSQSGRRQAQRRRHCLAKCRRRSLEGRACGPQHLDLCTSTHWPGKKSRTAPPALYHRCPPAARRDIQESPGKMCKWYVQVQLRGSHLHAPYSKRPRDLLAIWEP